MTPESRSGLITNPVSPTPAIASAIAVRPGADAATIATTTATDVWTAACDPWSDLDLAAHGYGHLTDQAWMARAAGPIAANA